MLTNVMNWLSANWASLAVGLAVAVAIAAAAIKKKHNRRSCGCSCSGCPGATYCHKG